MNLYIFYLNIQWNKRHKSSSDNPTSLHHMGAAILDHIVRECSRPGYSPLTWPGAPSFYNGLYIKFAYSRTYSGFTIKFAYSRTCSGFTIKFAYSHTCSGFTIKFTYSRTCSGFTIKFAYSRTCSGFTIVDLSGFVSDMHISLKQFNNFS